MPKHEAPDVFQANGETPAVDRPEAEVIERPRPPRQPLVATWIPVTAIAFVVVVLAVVGLTVYSNFSTRMHAPAITGIDIGVARTRLAQQGLKISVSNRRFSAFPADTVLEQSPAATAEVRRGDTITVVVSAGTEEFAMPDVVGDGLVLAQGLLQDKGLEIRIEAQPSDQPSDTVLSTDPGPGAAVRTGDIVRVTVAAAGPGGTPLLPSSMRGVVLVLDAAPVGPKQVDVPLEVSRRLRSLLEASGALVISTRSIVDTGAAAQPPARAKRATEGSATVALGLDVSPTGPGGIAVATPKGGSALIVLASGSLASQISSTLAQSESKPPTRSQVTTDPVLGATRAPWARVTLGSFGSAEDVSQFRDPAWADGVARALYKAIAQLYGQKIVAP